MDIKKEDAFIVVNLFQLKHSEEITHVDHFLPWSVRNEVDNINSIWNLVLACQSCVNLKKSNRQPKRKFLDELHKRNEYLINSHHPLRET